MGQGSESCGAYEVEEDVYEDNLVTGDWVQRNGTVISVSDMSPRHMRNCAHMCEGLRDSANFSCEADKWQDWIDLFRDEITSRPTKAVGKKSYAPKIGTTSYMKCHCNRTYEARVVDLNRGWGLSCSKRCAAIRREFGRPAATKVNQEVCL